MIDEEFCVESLADQEVEAAPKTLLSLENLGTGNEVHNAVMAENVLKNFIVIWKPVVVLVVDN